MPEESTLLQVSEAQQKLLRRFSVLDHITVPLPDVVGRTLTSDIIAAYDLPPFPNSAMDGFAVRYEDIRTAERGSPVHLRVCGDIAAGHASKGSVQSGEAMRIMTGAPLPEGADTVVPVELTDFSSRQAGQAAPDWVQVYTPVDHGGNVRPAGQDVKRGEVVLTAGKPVRPQDAGLLSMLGVAQVSVYRRPKVAIFSSGDELLPVEAPLTPGKIHDANTYTLTALATRTGAEVMFLGVADDRPEAIRALLDKAVDESCDLIVSSAGVSVGALDFVRSVVETYGRLDFWKVNMRPGKPLAFGEYRGIPFIGLPGNPVSAFIGFEVFVRQAILKMCGVVNLNRPIWSAISGDEIHSDGRESYLRAKVILDNGRLVARLTGHQDSGNLRSLVQGNALLFVPSGVKCVPSGAQVSVWLLDDILYPEE